MKKLPILIALFGISLLIASCKNGHTGLLIPKDAAFVMEINNSSITSKLSWKELQQSSWFKDIYSSTDDSFSKKLMDNPEASGVNIKSNFALFLKKQGTNNYFAFEGNLTDPSAFENFVKKENHNAETKSDGDLKYIISNNALITWNDKKFIALANAPYLNSSAFGVGTMNQTNNPTSPDSLRFYAKDLYNLKSDQSIESDDHFTSLIKENGDIHFFINTGQYFSSFGGGMFEMLKVNSLFDGNVSTYTLNFEDGKISIKAKSYYGPTLKNIFDKYSFKNLTDDELKRIPKNSIAAFALNFQPEFIKEILKAAGLDGMANGFLGKENYSLDELISALKGQMIFSVSDFLFKKVEQRIEGINQTINTSKPSVNILFGSSVNNRSAFDKLLNILKSQAPAEQLSKINYKINNEWFAISNSPTLVDTFLTGGNGKAPFISKISGHPFGLYFDLKNIISGFRPIVTDSSTLKIIDLSTNMWQDIVITGGEYDKGTVTGDFTVNLVNKSTNSLKQLNTYTDQIKAIEKQRPRPEYTTTDSSTVNSMPLVDTTNSTH